MPRTYASSSGGVSGSGFVTLTTTQTITGTKTFQNSMTTFIGNVILEDMAVPVKAYRLRSSGSALDFEGGGTDLYLSTWSNPDFTGSQYQQIQFSASGGAMQFNRSFYSNTGSQTVGTSAHYWDQGFFNRVNLNSTAYIDGGTAGTLVMHGNVQLTANGTPGVGNIPTGTDTAGNFTWQAPASVSLTSGVTGVLPIANGGTGSGTQNFVDLTTAQTVGGAKAFSAATAVNNTLTITGNISSIGPQFTVIDTATPSATNGAGIVGRISTTPSAGSLALGFYLVGGNGVNTAGMVGFSTQAWTLSSAQGSQLQFLTTPNGSATRTTALTLDQDQSATFAGNMSIADGKTFGIGTSSGTVFGTSTSKMAFNGNSAIGKQGATVDPAVVLANYGLRTGGTAYPLTTSGAVNLSGAVVVGGTWAMGGGTPSATTTGWSTSGGTPTKVLANTSPSTTTLGNVLSALLTELIAKGIISA